MFFRERDPTDEGFEYSEQPSVKSERSFVTLMNNDFGDQRGPFAISAIVARVDKLSKQTSIP